MSEQRELLPHASAIIEQLVHRAGAILLPDDRMRTDKLLREYVERLISVLEKIVASDQLSMDVRRDAAAARARLADQLSESNSTSMT